MKLPILLGGTMLLALILTTPSAEAGECWAPSRNNGSTGTGESRSAAKFARLNAALTKAEAMMREDAALNAIDGVRLQANPSITYIDNDQPTYTGTVWVTLNEPGVWAESGCGLKQGEADYFHKYAASISFNQLTDIISDAGAQGEPGEPVIANMQPEAVELFRKTGVIRTLGQGVHAFRPDGGQVLVPLTVGEYIDMWDKRLKAFVADGGGEFATPQLQNLRAHRASLSPAQLKAQVWMDGSYSDQLWAHADGPTELGVPLFQIAPDLLKASADKTAVNLVTVTWYGPDGDPVTEALADWATDFSAARAKAFFNGADQ